MLDKLFSDCDTAHLMRQCTSSYDWGIAPPVTQYARVSVLAPAGIETGVLRLVVDGCVAPNGVNIQWIS